MIPQDTEWIRKRDCNFDNYTDVPTFGVRDSVPNEPWLVSQGPRPARRSFSLWLKASFQKVPRGVNGTSGISDKPFPSYVASLCFYLIFMGSPILLPGEPVACLSPLVNPTGPYQYYNASTPYLRPWTLWIGKFMPQVSFRLAVKALPYHTLASLTQRVQIRYCYRIRAPKFIIYIYVYTYIYTYIYIYARPPLPHDPPLLCL